MEGYRTTGDVDFNDTKHFYHIPFNKIPLLPSTLIMAGSNLYDCITKDTDFYLIAVTMTA